jgi:hypothetical protein
MKKVERVLNGSLGLKKSKAFTKLSQIHFCLLSLIFTKMFTIQGGEGNATDLHLRVKTFHKSLHSLFDIIKTNGGENEI